MKDSKKAEVAKSYLQQVGKIRQQILLLDSRLEELKERAESIPALNYDARFHRSGNDVSRTERLHIRIESCIETLIAKHTALLDIENRITEQVQRIPFENEQNVLMWRYIECRSLEETAIIMGYTYRHVTRLHGQGLLSFYDIFLNDEMTVDDSPI